MEKEMMKYGENSGENKHKVVLFPQKGRIKRLSYACR